MSTSGVSEMDMSSCSGSPSAYSDSPHNSPLQQVPLLSTNFTDSSCPGKRVYTFGTNGHKPYLSIIEQPQNHFRFRYDTEKSGSTHGCLLAKSYVDKKVSDKTFPTVELVNYHDNAIIKCSIKYQDNRKNLREAYKILEDDQDHFSCKVPEKNSYKVVFRGIGVHYKKRTDLATLLYSRRSEQIPKHKLNVKELRAQCDTLSKAMTQNIVCLQYTAHTPDGKEICQPVYSNPILNTKCSSTNVLNICRMNVCSGVARGGEDLFLLVDRIDKKDIEVNFYQENIDGKRIWSEKSSFAPNEVHYQCVIICRTPRYVDPHPLSDVPVYIELVRKSDGSTSAPKQFVYKADETYKQIKRRKMSKPWPAFPEAPLGIVGTPVKIIQPKKTNQQYKMHPTQIANVNVMHQPIQQTTCDWDSLFTNVLNTVLDDCTDQTIVEPLEGTNISQGIIVQTRGDVSQTIQLEGDKELQRALDVYRTIQSQKTSETQENMDLQRTLGIYETVVSNTGESQGTVAVDMQLTNTIDLHFVDESRGIVEFQIPNDTQNRVQGSHLLEGFDIDLQETNKTEVSSPMWGVPMSYEPRQRLMSVPVPLPTTEVNPTIVEEDLMSLDWFQEYENSFKLDVETDPKMKHSSIVSDSGRVKVEMKSSSTQTDRELNENSNLQLEMGQASQHNNSSASTSVRRNTNVEDLEIIKVREESGRSENVAHKIEVVIKKEDNQIDAVDMNKIAAAETKVKLEEIPNKNVGFILCSYRGIEDEMKLINQFKKTRKLLLYESDEKETSINNTDVQETPLQNTQESQCTVPNTKTSENMGAKSDKEGGQKTNYEISPDTSLDSMEQSKGDYPVEFSPEDAAEVKKLVQELAEIVRNKKDGATDVIKTKLQRLFDIRYTNGDTFLHMALFKSQRSFEALVKMAYSVKMSHLLNYGNNRGESILHLAVVHGSPQLVEMLVERGCDPMACTAEENTSVHYAVRYGREAALRALLDGAARRRLPLQLDARNVEGCSALHLCALHARAECARLLCARGAALEARDAAGRTPLQLCALDTRPDVARALLQHAVARGELAEGALHVLCARRPHAPADPALARLLLEHGARPPPHMARMPHLAPILKEFLTEDEFEELVAKASSENESDKDSDNYESADDESIEAPDCLASRLEELELFDDAKLTSDME